MSRLDEIVREADKICKDRFNENSILLQKELENKWEILEKNFKNVLDELLEKTQIMQETGKKGKGKYLTISHLYSSFLAGKYEYRIDILDEQMYLDEQEVCAYWVLDFLIPYIEKDCEYFREILQRKFIRLREYEIKEVIWNYQFYYHSLVYNILCCLKKRIELLSDFQVLFGEYMGRAYLIE